MASPDALETACILQSPWTSWSPGTDVHSTGPQTRLLYPERRAERPSIPAVFLPPLRGTQCITVLITSWALGRNTPKEAFLSTPHPQCRAGGPEWTPVIMAPAGAQGEREGSWVPAVCLLPQQDKQGSRAPTLGTKGRGQNPPPVSPKTANMLPQRLS